MTSSANDPGCVKTIFLFLVVGSCSTKSIFWPMVCHFDLPLGQKTKKSGNNLPLGFLEFAFSHTLDPIPNFCVRVTRGHPRVSGMPSVFNKQRMTFIYSLSNSFRFQNQIDIQNLCPIVINETGKNNWHGCIGHDTRGLQRSPFANLSSHPSFSFNMIGSGWVWRSIFWSNKKCLKFLHLNIFQ